MAEYTEHYNAKKPAKSENYDVEVLSLKVNGKEKATIKKSDLP